MCERDIVSTDTRHLLAYSFLKGVGRRFLTDISIEKESNGTKIDVCFENKLKSSNKSFSNIEISTAFKSADQQIETAKNNGHRIISRLDIQFPNSLKKMSDAPVMLFCHGNIELLKTKSVSIIGTREPTLDGSKIAARVTKWFTYNGWTITSGLALGIDTLAHQYCLKSNGNTIAVLAHGLEKIYPTSNKNLSNSIINSNGLLISEYKYNSFVARSNFVERDRIQAGLSHAVILIQSDIKGGSLYASRAALKYDRYLVVVGQSKKDISNNESKIQANMSLINENIRCKKEIFDIPEEQVNKILPLLSKDDYNTVNDKISKVSFEETQSKHSTINLFD
ncbi:DNA-protecting protein DprA [Shewanella sp. A3A]|nr:DNA-protecting protein DprA [Shewanella ferrihydritica]